MACARRRGERSSRSCSRRSALLTSSIRRSGWNVRTCSIARSRRASSAGSAKRRMTRSTSSRSEPQNSTAGFALASVPSASSGRRKERANRTASRRGRSGPGACDGRPVRPAHPPRASRVPARHSRTACRAWPRARPFGRPSGVGMRRAGNAGRVRKQRGVPSSRCHAARVTCQIRADPAAGARHGSHGAIGARCR